MREEMKEEELPSPIPMQIDTSGSNSSGAALNQSTLVLALEQLNLIASVDITPGPQAQASLKATVTTLFKVISNILGAPLEPKFRKLPKKSGAV